ncbi:MAG: NADH-quinone oxidoreductase subunit NuoN [Proteobacteria bacterium]|nr:NADH-quinone oxidoreductase subunit NuoN [Pseudomonadota bacterium]
MPVAAFPDLIPAIPEIYLAVSAMILLMLGVYSTGKQTVRTVSYLSTAALFFAIPLTVMVTDGRMVTFGGLFVTDSFAVYAKILVLVSAGAAIVMAQDYLERQDIARFEFPVLVVLASLGMLMMISANDLMSLYLGLELQSLALYVIASFQRDSIRSAEAGLKYFVLGALASGILLYGMSLIYGFAGTTNFDSLAEVFKAVNGTEPHLGVIVGIVFIIAGLAFKVSAVPFHMWTPDVYEGAPTPVTALFAVAPKIAAMALFARVLVGPFGDLAGEWQQIIIFISIASMALGAFAAINQNNIKRLMAYSSIGHMGYALIGLAAAGSAVSAEVRAAGIQGLLIYLAIYMFMNIGTFACILLMRRQGRMLEGIDDLAGLSKSNPVMAMVLAVFMFSMAGIPPLAGFFGKFYIFAAAIEADLFALAIIGVLASVVAAFYYLRIIKVMYFDSSEEEFDRPVSRDMKSILVITGVVVILFFIYPDPVLNGAELATSALFPQ